MECFGSDDTIVMRQLEPPISSDEEYEKIVYRICLLEELGGRHAFDEIMALEALADEYEQRMLHVAAEE
jgi:hypothetical protein